MKDNLYTVDGIDVSMKPANPLSKAEYSIPALAKQKTVVFKKGTVIEKGYHTVYTGGKYGSVLMLPIAEK